jgi:hypothetical protein
MKKCLVLTLLLFISAAAFAQPKAAAAKWVKIEGAMRGYSFLLPEGYFAYLNRKTGETFLSSYKDDVSINIDITSDLFSRELLKGLEDRYGQSDCKYDYYTLGPYSGKFFTCDNNKQFSKTIYLASGNDFFKITVGAVSEFEKPVTKFLSSLRFHGAPLFSRYNAPSAGDEVSINSFDLKNDPLVDQYMNKPDNENIKWTNSGKARTTLFDADSIIYSRSLVIIRRKKPSFFIKHGVSALVKVKIYFLATGQIENVEVISSTGTDHTVKVIDSLKEMRFVLAQVNGKDVDCSKVLEFAFD